MRDEQDEPSYMNGYIVGTPSWRCRARFLGPLILFTGNGILGKHEVEQGLF